MLPPQISTGDIVTAKWLNDLREEVKKLSNIRGAGNIEVSNMAGGITLRGLESGTTDTYVGVAVLPIPALTNDGGTITPGSGTITLQKLNDSSELISSERTEGVYNLTEETIPNGSFVTAVKNSLDGNLYITQFDRILKRGVLDDGLGTSEESSATMSVYKRNIVDDTWEDTGDNITVYASVPIGTGIAAGKAVKAYLHHTQWFIDTSEC